EIPADALELPDGLPHGGLVDVGDQAKGLEQTRLCHQRFPLMASKASAAAARISVSVSFSARYFSASEAAASPIFPSEVAAFQRKVALESRRVFFRADTASTE